MSVLCITGGSVCFVAWTLLGSASEGKRIEEGQDASCVSGIKVEFDAVSYSFYIATVVYISAIIFYGRLNVLLFVLMPIAYLVYLFVLAAQTRESSDVTSTVAFQAEAGSSELAGMKPPDSDSFLARLAWAIAWPTYAVRWVLIPPADLQWDPTRRLLSALSPCGLFCLWICCRPSDLMGSKMPCVVASTAIVASTSLYIYFGSDNGPKVPYFYPVLTLLSKISSILVLAVIAAELTALVQAIGVIKGVSRLWLGSTVVAWGNSLGDLVTGIAMVRHGQMRAALTAVLAGPLFNCLVGSGTAFLIASQQVDRPSVFVKGQVTTVLASNLGFLVLAATFFAIAFRSFSRKRGVWWLGPCALYCLYAVFLPVTLIQESGS
jgi:Ca2+/Na+ antiporter